MQTVEAHSISSIERKVCVCVYMLSFSVSLSRFISSGYVATVGKSRRRKNKMCVCVCVWCFCDMAITTFISMCLTHRLYFSLKLSCYLHITHTAQILSHFMWIRRRIKCIRNKHHAYSFFFTISCSSTN